MLIGTRTISPDHPPYVIAELGVNHDGSAARALELVQLAAEAGADAIKLQLFEADRLMSKAAKLAAYQKAAGERDPVEMLRRLELSIDDMAPCVDLAHKLGIHAIVSVFSVELVPVAERLAWDAYKTASPDIINRPLLEGLAATGKPLIVSTGASTMEEVERAVEWLRPIQDRLAVLQCVSSYPTPDDQRALGGICAISSIFSGTVGYSDHTKGNGTGAFAVAWGASILEKHFTYDRRAAGPDHAASLPPWMFERYAASARRVRGTWQRREQLRDRAQLDRAWDILSSHNLKSVEFDDCPTIDSQSNPELEEAIDFCWRAKLIDPFFVRDLEKRVLPIEQDVRTVSRQSLTTTRPLPIGHTIARADLTIKRPGTGIPPYELDATIGRRLARGVEADMPLMPDDLVRP